MEFTMIQMITFEHSIPSSFLFTVDSFLFQVSSVIRGEVDDRIIEHSKPFQGIEDLSSAPIHLFHSVSIQTMFGTAPELGCRVEDRVDLEPWHHQEEWLTVPGPILQIINPLPHETLCEVLESDRLFHEVVVPHDDRVQQLHVVGDEEEIEERREDDCTEDHQPTRSEHSVRLQQPAPQHCPEQEGQQRRVHVDVEAGQHTQPIITEVLQIGQRDSVEIIEALIQRVVTEVIIVATVHPQMPLPCRRKHTNIL